jgi:hypothetical protein
LAVTVVFLKTHKCASSALQNIFIRNGFKNNKIFVLPAESNFLGATEPFHQSLVPDPKLFNNEYNILTHHTRFNYQSMSSLMPNGTVFVTMLRDPIYQFESLFVYSGLNKIWNITFDSFGDQSFKIPENIYFERWFGMIGFNQMMFDLGMNVSDFNKPLAVGKYIEELDSHFDLVMILERFEESLILLKHLLCWNTDDLVVFKVFQFIKNKFTVVFKLTFMAHFLSLN